MRYDEYHLERAKDAGWLWVGRLYHGSEQVTACVDGLECVFGFEPRPGDTLVVTEDGDRIPYYAVPFSLWLDPKYGHGHADIYNLRHGHKVTDIELTHGLFEILPEHGWAWVVKQGWGS